MVKKYFCSLLAFCFFFPSPAKCQLSDSASLHFRASEIGCRFSPDGIGIAGIYPVSPGFALCTQVNVSEGLNDPAPQRADFARKVTGYGSGIAATILIEYNFFDNKFWRFFSGQGIHFGRWDKYDSRDNIFADPPQGIFGMDAIAGIEYRFASIPIAITADIKPAINILDEVAFYPDNMFGLSVSYYFRGNK